MHIEIEPQAYEKFNVALSSKEGAQPFLVIKGCKIANGSKGPFLSGPATKKTDGTYFNNCYFGDKFSQAVMEKAGSMPKAEPKHDRRMDAVKARQLDDDVPF